MTTDPRTRIERSGRLVALRGLALPLLLIGGLKFTPIEVEGLKPLISGRLGWRGCTPFRRGRNIPSARDGRNGNLLALAIATWDMAFNPGM